MMTRSKVGTIRAATLDDIPSLASMHVASWRETYTGIMPDATLLSLSVEARTLRTHSRSPLAATGHDES